MNVPSSWQYTLRPSLIIRHIGCFLNLGRGMCIDAIKKINGLLFKTSSSVCQEEFQGAQVAAYLWLIVFLWFAMFF